MQVVELPSELKERRKDNASLLEELAKRVAEGDIIDFVLVYTDKDRGIGSAGFFEDRLRLLGAIEEAKIGISNN